MKLYIASADDRRACRYLAHLAELGAKTLQLEESAASAPADKDNVILLFSTHGTFPSKVLRRTDEKDAKARNFRIPALAALAGTLVALNQECQAKQANEKTSLTELHKTLTNWEPPVTHKPRQKRDRRHTFRRGSISIGFYTDD